MRPDPNTGYLILSFVLFSALDSCVSILSLGFGKHAFFNSTLILEQFQGQYQFGSSLMDFFILCVIRSAVVLGTLIAIILKIQLIKDVKKNMNDYKAVLLSFLGLLCIYSPIKLLVVSEVPSNLKIYGFWFSFTWNMLASLILFIIWTIACRFTIEKSETRGESDKDDEERLLTTDSNEASNQKTSKNDRGTYVYTMRVIGYCKPEWLYYTLAFICLFVYSAANIFIPYYIGQVIANVVITKSYSDLIRCIIIIIGLSLTVGVFGGLRGCLFVYANARVSRSMRGGLFRSLLNQEIGFFDVNKTGEVTSRLSTDCQTVADLISNNVNIFLRNLVMMLGSLAVMTRMSWRLTVLTFVATPLLIIIAKIYGTYYDKLAEEGQKSLAKANEVADEVLSSMRTVRSFATEQTEGDRYWSFLTDNLHIMRTKAIAHIGFIFTNEALERLTLVTVVWYGGHLVLTHRMSADTLITFLLYQLQLSENIYYMSMMWTSLLTAVGASRKIFEYIDRQPTVRNEGKHSATTLQGKIQFADVSFAYPSRPQSEVLKKLSFAVDPGETVALVGPSGGGKSSCIALLEHFYETVQGRLLLDDIPLADYAHKYLHTKIALVGQEPVLFGRSIRENIIYGLEMDVSDEDVHRVAKMANAHDFIVELKDGYDTQVGEKGVQMSGGQKQRIAIARALIRQPTVLLLDEATSALDSESEHLVQKAIYSNLSGHTVLLIAHRLSTVEKADRIVVLNRGSLVQQGTHRQLLARDGLYRQLVHRQLFFDGNGMDETGDNQDGENKCAEESDRSEPLEFRTIQSSEAEFHSPLVNSLGSSLNSNSSKI